MDKSFCLAFKTIDVLVLYAVILYQLWVSFSNSLKFDVNKED